jgi:thiol-disulfide isomerase/thioredoxin
MTKMLVGILILLCSVTVVAQSEHRDLALRDIYGHTIKLSDYRGKVVLLNFWAPWCPPCRTEIPELVKLQREYRKAGLQIIGITYPPEKLSSVRKFAATSKANYPLALGTKSNKLVFTSSEVLPITVVIDRRGVTREVIEGILLPDEFDEKIKPLLSDSFRVKKTSQTVSSKLHRQFRAGGSLPVVNWCKSRLRS